MFAFTWDEFGFRGASVAVGLFLGTAITWIVARWKRIREYRNILRGDARDTVVIAHHLVEQGSSTGSVFVAKSFTFRCCHADKKCFSIVSRQGDQAYVQTK